MTVLHDPLALRAVTVSCSVLALVMTVALASGRSTGIETVSSGAATMKMISNTSMTSTIGVTLISLITP